MRYAASENSEKSVAGFTALGRISRAVIGFTEEAAARPLVEDLLLIPTSLERSATIPSYCSA